MTWWEWLSGKKTVIGGYILLLAAFITEVVIGQWGIDSDIVPKIVGTLTWIGGILTATGGAHKIGKAIKKKIQ